MAFFGMGSSICDVKIEFKDQENLRTVPCKNEQGDFEDLYLFTAAENVAGTVLVVPKKKLDHTGIRLELIGQIEYLYDKANPYEFVNVAKDLDGPGDLADMKKYTFEFENVSKEHETYMGANVRLRYFLRVKISRNYNPIVAVKEFAVLCCTEEPETNNSIKMEVGIEDCLHIEFEYNKTKYHLQDVVIGKIYFLLVRIKIKHMELVIIKRESTGTGNAQYNESENVAKYEIMDGAPVRGENIPVRLFLSPFDLSPTYKNVHNRFSVKYFLNLVLVDEEDRRYFKQQEIILWRKQVSTQKPEVDELTTAQ